MSEKRVELERSAEINERLDRIAYALLGRFYRNKSEYKSINRHLKQARMDVPVDVYLSRVLLYSITGGFVGVAVGLLIGLTGLEFLLDIDFGFQTTNPTLIWLFEVTQEYAFVIVPFVLAVVIGLPTALVVERVGMWYPKNKAGNRKRNIDANLPRAVFFLYSLSKGGTNIVTVFRAIADEKEAYGEVAEEFAAIVRLIEYQNMDIISAIQQVAYTTPSDTFQDFLEDMITNIESGADIGAFFEQQQKQTREAAFDEAENNLQFLELIGEMYLIIPAVAGIMVYILSVAVGIQGDDLTTEVAFYVYVATPVITLLFALIVQVLTNSSSESVRTITVENTETPVKYESLFEPTESTLVTQVQKTIFYTIVVGNKLSTVLRAFKTRLYDTPAYTSILTVPVSVLLVYYLHSAEIADLSINGFLADPIGNTVLFIGLPLYIIGIPIVILYEIESRRQRKILDRLPEILRSTSETNKRGIRFEETLKIIGERSDSYVANEIEKAHNEISWTGNVRESLLKFSNRLRNPRLTKTINLITKSYDTSGDVSTVLETAARDVETQAELDKKQKQGSQITMVLILVVFLLSLGILLAMDVMFITTFEEVSEGMNTDGVQQAQGFGDGFDIDTLRLLGLHFPIILGVTAGILIGALGNGRVESGVKWSLSLFTITILAFLLI